LEKNGRKLKKVGVSYEYKKLLHADVLGKSDGKLGASLEL